MSFGDPIHGRTRHGLIYLGPRVAPLTDDPDLLCYLGFEEGSGEQASDAYTWTMTKHPTKGFLVYWDDGKVGKGLRFSHNTVSDIKHGSSTGYVPEDAPEFNLQVFSVSIWFKTLAANAWGLLYKNFIWRGKPDRYYGFGFEVINTGEIRVTLANGTATVNALLVGADWRDGIWHHVVATYADSVATAYIDNVEKGTLTGNIVYESITNSSSPVGDGIRIGGDGPACNSLYGIIDEFYLFSKVLSASERGRLYGVG